MQFITSGNRIAVENFTLGDLYTITFTSGTYINSACIGIGENFVSFQRNEPELLFTLNMETAELVSSIDLYAGGTGTNNYNELSNKPQIGGVELVGNKSLSALGIQAEITEESPLSSSLVSGLGSAAAANSSDFATAAQGALAASAIQSAGSGLSKDGTTLNHSNSVTTKTTEGFAAITYDAQGHITGSTAATTAQLTALNSGITSTDVAQIETNKNNILSNTLEDISSSIVMSTGYYCASDSRLYKQGKHIFGKIYVYGKDDNNNITTLPTVLTAVATLPYKPNVPVITNGFCCLDLYRIDNLGYVYVNPSTGVLNIRDNSSPSSNRYMNIDIDFVIS